MSSRDFIRELVRVPRSPPLIGFAKSGGPVFVEESAEEITAA